MLLYPYDRVRDFSQEMTSSEFRNEAKLSGPRRVRQRREFGGKPSSPTVRGLSEPSTAAERSANQ
jgi:hypothetical protein